ncbi:hypothetical protein ACFX13_024962 [Malus domestica]
MCSPISSNLLHLARAKDRLSLLSLSSSCRTEGGVARRLTWAKSRLGMGRGGIVAGTTALSCSTWLEPRAACVVGAADCGARAQC